MMRKFLRYFAISISLYHLYVALFGIQEPFLHRAVHVTSVLALSFALSAARSGRARLSAPTQAVNWAMAILSVLTGVYLWLNTARVNNRMPQADPVFTADLVFGVILLIVVLEAARQRVGVSLLVIPLVFLVYMYVGPYMPAGLYHSGYPVKRIAEHLLLTYEGIFSSPIEATSSYVILFILFGTFFEKAGAGEFFFKLASGLVGTTPGGPAKVSVVASALFGTMSGSPVGNVVTTGSITIPMMKRVGYRPAFAAAVEAVAATGGAIMPPVMGSAAFLMTQVTGIPYMRICIAAAIPALLYYIALGTMVHLEAVKTGLRDIAREDIPSIGKTLKEGGHFLFPLVVMIYMLVKGYPLMAVGLYSIIATILISWFHPAKGMRLKDIADALERGAITATSVVASCAAAGIVIASIGLTGIGGKMASICLSLTGGNVLLTLIFTAIVCLILGLGIPVQASYLLTAALMAPALVQLKIPVLAAHLFIVYYSVSSAITPPEAGAAFAAASLAEANPMAAGWQACRLGIVSYLVPFMFVYEPGIMLAGPVPTILYTSAKALVATIALSFALEGWAAGPLNTLQKVVLALGGLLLFSPGSMTSVAGMALCAVALAPSIGRLRGARSGREA